MTEKIRNWKTVAISVEDAALVLFSLTLLNNGQSKILSTIAVHLEDQIVFQKKYSIIK